VSRLPATNHPEEHDRGFIEPVSHPSPWGRMKTIAAVALAVHAVLAVNAEAQTSVQAFPVKPLRIISTTAAGGVNDILSRAFAQAISQSVGQPVIVENKPGAGSIIGMTTLAQSAPDGYTVALTTPEPLVYNPLLYVKLPYDAGRDFAPVTQVTRSENVIVASPETPGNNFPEVIAYAKANPGKLNFGTWGTVSTPAMYLAWINRQNGVDITPIPYKGAAFAVPATIANQVQLTFIALGFVVPQLKAGKLKALAFTGSRRSLVMPDLPTLAEYNSDPELDGFFGIFAPAGTPSPILERLAGLFTQCLRNATVTEILARQTQVGVGGSPAEFAKTVREAKASTARIFQLLGIKPTEAPF